ncbi:YopX family protein [Prevotella sp.]|uniref:YopX family protein n=1 Tax=Prevotella sp. TaxID=59823 RepID=UPI0040283605
MKIENIKFKAKRLDGKGWIEGTPICINGKPYGIMIGEKESPDIDPSTICQFTGEKDMNGDDIYVGDIISNLETKSVIEVVWNDKMKMLDCKFLNGVKCCFDIPFGTFVARYHRIVVLRSKFDKEK